MIDMSCFKDFFKSEIEYRDDFSMVMDYNNAKVDKRIKSFVFVEGSTDERFYKYTNNLKLSDCSKYIYKVSDGCDDEYVGKEAVFYTYKTIASKETLNKEIDRCVFIVDRDYSVELKSHKLKMEKTDTGFIHITKGHSFEDYFIDGSNIDKLFEYYHLSEEALTSFKDAFIAFFSITYEYFALCGVLADVFGDVEKKYKKKYAREDLIILDFANNNVVDKDKILEENRNIRAYLRDIGMKDLYKSITERASKSPIYLRGHNVYEYIQKYLSFYHNIVLHDRSSDYQRIVNSMSVELCHY